MSDVEIRRDMQMEEVLDRMPGARRALFQRYHVGGCSSCGFTLTDTLEEVCGKHNLLDVDEVIEHLKRSYEMDQALQLSPREIRERLANGDDVHLLDLRPGAEQATVKIDGATPVDDRVAQELMSWPKEAEIILIDQAGDRSLDAAAYLAGHGFTNVRAMAGGMDAWTREVDPSVARH